MSNFRIDSDLEIGTVFEVTGAALKISLSKDIKELTRSHSGRVYDVGQIGSILKIHLGRKIIFATVRLLRLQSDDEQVALSASDGYSVENRDKRVLEADLLGKAGIGLVKIHCSLPVVYRTTLFHCKRFTSLPRRRQSNSLEVPKKREKMAFGDMCVLEHMLVPLAYLVALI